ncbi:unnamed protein product [Rotaria sordida]|uniref:Uncharacterized protein n=1 Tax=Rotaria sordida TaxID=392033 RepID=A0A814MJX3_9BILA|nr:unnamed protein product [Rotaria sordida]
MSEANNWNERLFGCFDDCGICCYGEKLRKMYGLREDPKCGDVPATLCCSSCALCQEAREMKSRGHYAGKSQDTYYMARSAPVSSQPTYIRKLPQDIYESRAF